MDGSFNKFNCEGRAEKNMVEGRKRREVKSS